MPRTFARSATPRAAGVLLLFAAVAAVFATQFQTANAASPSIPTRHAGYVPVLQNHRAQPQDNCPPSGCGGGKLIDHGGPTMTTNKTYSIFWVPAGQTVSANYASTINQFFQDVAHDSGLSTNVYASDTQYSNILYSSTYGGTYTDTASFPANGCTPYGGGSVCLSDSQLQAEINKVITAQGWVKNSTNMFFIFTPKNVESCDGTGDCSFTAYCAYHGVTSSGAVYANMPYGVNTHYPGNCDVGEYPNGDDADATINVTSHEHNEAITDYQLNAWYDSQGYENGDKCAWTFGALSGPSGGEYNQTINGHHYFLQEEFSNSSGSNGLCVQTYQIQGGGGNPPTVTSFSPTSGAVGTQVDVQGTNFTGATSVTFNGTSDTSFQVNSSTDITAHVPSGATTGPIAVTTPDGTGASSTNFTVTTSGGNPPAVTSFSPASGAAGTNVSITGTGFTGVTGVTFNGTTASFTFNSDTSVSARVPTGATTGPIAVTTPNGTGTSSTSFTVTTPPQRPTISGFSPTSGRRGSSVTITGTNFSGATSVKLGVYAASYTVNSSTKITAVVPSAARVGYQYKWSVTTAGGTATSFSYFRVTG